MKLIARIEEQDKILDQQMNLPVTCRSPVHLFVPFSSQRVFESRKCRELSWIEPPAKVKKLSVSSKLPAGLIGLPLAIQQQILAQMKGSK